MVERRRLIRAEKTPARRGRPAGGESEFKRVARAKARMLGLLPDELLLRWARTGRMEYPQHAKNKAKYVELAPADRISCAKGCATFYKAPYQARPQPGEAAPVVRLEIDDRVLAALAKSHPDKLEVLRDVLRMIGAGGLDLAALAGMSAGKADPARFARALRPDSETAGRA